MKTSEIYNDVLKSVTETIALTNADVSLCNYGDNFSVVLFEGKGDKKESVCSFYFSVKDSEKALQAKFEGFSTMANFLMAQ